jgi:hypothetical protein
VHELLRQAIPWDDERVPVEVYGPRLGDKRYVRFEDQRSRLRPGSTFVFDIPRSEEARALVEALARWEWLGQQSWHFADGERHKRVVARWLRRNIPKLIRALEPPDTLDRDTAMMHGVRVLSAAALLRRGSDFPSDRLAVVRELLEDVPPVLPLGADKEDEAFLQHVWAAQQRVKQFVLGELAARQGGAKGGLLFINPLPLLKHARSLRSEPVAAELDREFLNSGRFWQTRYAALAASDRLANLTTALEPRRRAVLHDIAGVRAALLDAEIPGEDLSAAVAAYCGQVAALLATQAKEFPMAHPGVDVWRPLYSGRGAAWGRTLAETEQAARSEQSAALLTVPMADFRDAVSAMSAASDFIRTLEAEVTLHERTLVADGDPALLLEEIRKALVDLADGAPEPEVPAMNEGAGR